MNKYIVGEHYYTTSKFKNGLHTLDNSKFLSADEVDSLEKLGVYQTASGLNNNPTDAEIENNFPVNIAFFKLPVQPNRFVYLHSKYTGRANHTPDRFGNFFSHSVILKDAQPDFSAIHFFNQFDFKKEFTIQEDENFKPYLVEREIQVDVRMPSQTFFNFCNFFTQEKNLEVFATVIDSIVNGALNAKGSNITICGEREKIREIILAVNFFLPQHIANKISFATYVNNPSRYPFQLTGIIPECGITTLDSRYYTLINVDSVSNYEPKHDYTKFLVNAINDKSDSSFEQWKALNAELKSLGITEPNSRLNAPIAYQEFVSEIFLKKIQDLRNLLSMNLPSEKVLELKKITIEKNPELYLEFVLDELKSAKTRAYTFNEKRDAYSRVYLEHFENNKQFRENYLSYLVDVFREGLSATEKSQASLHILSTSNCNDITPNWINERLQEADFFFENEFIDIEQRVDEIKMLNEKYNLNLFQNSIPNIMKIKSFDDIRKAAEKDDFVRGIKKHNAFLIDASDKEIFEVLLLGFNHDSNFMKGNFQDFENYISIIKKYLPEQQEEFWFRFFDSNRSFNKENNPKKHSLDYLKKRFVSLLFLNQHDNLNLFSKLRLEDEYTIRWIEEDIREHTKKEAVLQTFAEAFSNYNSVRNSSFWSIFRRR
jgi:hypothetical protein